MCLPIFLSYIELFILNMPTLLITEIAPFHSLTNVKSSPLIFLILYQLYQSIVFVLFIARLTY